jgi:hypothetical protein
MLEITVDRKHAAATAEIRDENRIESLPRYGGGFISAALFSG